MRFYVNMSAPARTPTGSGPNQIHDTRIKVLPAKGEISRIQAWPVTAQVKDGETDFAPLAAVVRTRSSEGLKSVCM